MPGVRFCKSYIFQPTVNQAITKTIVRFSFFFGEIKNLKHSISLWYLLSLSAPYETNETVFCYPCLVEYFFHLVRSRTELDFHRGVIRLWHPCAFVWYWRCCLLRHFRKGALDRWRRSWAEAYRYFSRSGRGWCMVPSK